MGSALVNQESALSGMLAAHNGLIGSSNSGLDWTEIGQKVKVWGACEANEKLLLAITDEGEGFDPASVPDPTQAENIFSDHGRGVFLINRLMCETEYRLGGRQVLLRKHVARDAPAQE